MGAASTSLLLVAACSLSPKLRKPSPTCPPVYSFSFRFRIRMMGLTGDVFNQGWKVIGSSPQLIDAATGNNIVVPGEPTLGLIHVHAHPPLHACKHMHTRTRTHSHARTHTQTHTNTHMCTQARAFGRCQERSWKDLGLLTGGMRLFTIAVSKLWRQDSFLSLFFFQGAPAE